MGMTTRRVGRSQTVDYPGLDQHGWRFACNEELHPSVRVLCRYVPQCRALTGLSLHENPSGFDWTGYDTERKATYTIPEYSLNALEREFLSLWLFNNKEAFGLADDEDILSSMLDLRIDLGERIQTHKERLSSKLMAELNLDNLHLPNVGVEFVRTVEETPRGRKLSRPHHSASLFATSGRSTKQLPIRYPELLQSLRRIQLIQILLAEDMSALFSKEDQVSSQEML